MPRKKSLTTKEIRMAVKKAESKARKFKSLKSKARAFSMELKKQEKRFKKRKY